MKRKVGNSLMTGAAVAALAAGAAVFASPAAPAHADGGESFECTPKIDGAVGKLNCDDGLADHSPLRGNFAAKYKCGGSDRWTQTGWHTADGEHPIEVKCAPALGVTDIKVVVDPVPV